MTAKDLSRDRVCAPTFTRGYDTSDALPSTLFGVPSRTPGPGPGSLLCTLQVVRNQPLYYLYPVAKRLVAGTFGRPVVQLASSLLRRKLGVLDEWNQPKVNKTPAATSQTNLTCYKFLLDHLSLLLYAPSCMNLPCSP